MTNIPDSVLEAMVKCVDDAGWKLKDGMKDALTALEASGYAVVPKEPTVAMFEAGYSDNDGDRITSVTEIYKAMLAAARES